LSRRQLPPIHQGEIPQRKFLAPLGTSHYRAASGTCVSPRRTNEIIRGTRAITADTALRLSRYFGTSERFWLNLQVRLRTLGNRSLAAGLIRKSRDEP
jgi:addiction module HigA family antidote